MRAVLSNCVRPHVSRSQPLLWHGPSDCSHKILARPFRRKLKLCDAFTILLAPLLSAAFVVDITHKDKRRREWDRRIAQVQQEVEEMSKRETRSWGVLHRSSADSIVGCRRRSYSTARDVIQPEYVDTDAENDILHNEIDEVPVVNVDQVDSDLFADLQRYENLLATKMGLQLMLYIATGAVPSVRMNMRGLSDGVVVLDDMDALLKHLTHINHSLLNLDQKLPDNIADLNGHSPDRIKLDDEISQLAWKCRTGDISTHELIYHYTQAVMQSRTGPSLGVYQRLVATFSTLDADSLTAIAMFPYLKTKQILSDQNVGNIIQQFGQVKDSRKLEQFLRRLTQADKDFKTANKWEHVIVAGVRVPVPVNRRPRLLDILVRAALQGDQPHKARAWATLLLQQDISSSRLAALFNNFLTYHAAHYDWKNGQLWLERAVAWATLFAKETPLMFQKILFRILDLCKSCDQPELYDRILDALIKAGLALPPEDTTRPDAFSDQARKIRNDWLTRRQAKLTQDRGSQGMADAATMFQAEMAKVESAIQSFIGITDVTKLRQFSDVSEARQAEESISFLSGSDPKPTRLAADVSFLDTPDDLLSAVSIKKASSSAPVIDTSDTSSCPSGQSAARQIDGDTFETRDAQQSVRLLLLEQAYRQLHERYKEQRGTTERLQRLLQADTLPMNRGDSSPDQRHIESQDVNINPEARLNTQSVEAFSTDRSFGIERYPETKDQVMGATTQPGSHLNAVKPKSLETVFIEKENLKMRIEMRNLALRHVDMLREKENVSQELAVSQSRHKRYLEEVARLQQNKEDLQKELQAVNAENLKLSRDMKSREGNWRSLMAASEERAKTLEERTGRQRAELTQVKALLSQLRSEQNTAGHSESKVGFRSSDIPGQEQGATPRSHDKDEDKSRRSRRNLNDVISFPSPSS